MNKTFNLLFYVKKAKVNTLGEAPIYLRMTLDGQISELSTKRTILPQKWNSTAQRASGSSEEIKALNFYLKSFEQKIYDVYHCLLREKDLITSQDLKNHLLGVKERSRMLVSIFEDHNNRMAQLLGKEFSKGTLQRYKTCLLHLKDFLSLKLHVNDIAITKIDLAFINDFEFYLRTKPIKPCANNSAVKYIKNFGKIIRICLVNRWLSFDPFMGYNSKFSEVNRGFLDEAELLCLENKEFAIERIEQVRDIFVFSCYTGLAFIDAWNLTPDNIGIGLDANKWIFTSRQKTKIASHIPLLPQAEAIVQKYQNHPICVSKGKLLPLLSNQKMNAYLKEIADLCGISKELTFHIARHTFATTVTLANGVSIESVSKMLGHKNIKTTQHYAKILDKKVGEDMLALQALLQKKENLKKQA
ncbi:site-specific integrase [Soonwooa purpurea]